MLTKLFFFVDGKCGSILMAYIHGSYGIDHRTDFLVMKVHGQSQIFTDSRGFL